MRRIASTIAFASVALIAPAAFAAPGDACALLTQAQVSAALGIPTEAGSPIFKPTACQWMGKGKFATLTITQPRAGKSPVEQFDAGKKGMVGVTAEPVGGVGDDAYYVYFSGTTRAGLGLVVKKGSATFEVRVYGFDLDKAKPVAKTLAQNAAGKL
jgi:hypothetical protein